VKDGRRTGGFGFIRDDSDRDRFFHARDLRGVHFDMLTEDMAVEFTPTDSGKGGNGLRAESVSIA